MKPTDYPVSYVYVHWTSREDDGAMRVARYVVSHDGVQQACDEAIRGLGLDPLLIGTRIHEIEVFAGVTPRRFFHEPVVRRTFQLKERT